MAEVTAAETAQSVLRAPLVDEPSALRRLRRAREEAVGRSPTSGGASASRGQEDRDHGERAGGRRAVVLSAESAEDDAAAGTQSIRRRVRPGDVVEGIAA